MVRAQAKTNNRGENFKHSQEKFTYFVVCVLAKIR